MASSQYYVRNQEGAYFLPMTVVDWVEVSSGLTPFVFLIFGKFFN